MLINQLYKERNQLVTHCKELQSLLKTLPKGELLCVRNGSYVKWFKSNGVNPIYINKKNRAFAQQLAIRKYYELQLEEINKQIHIIDKCIKQYYAIPSKSSSLLESSSCYLELIKSHFNTYPEKIQQWISAEYEQNQNYQDLLIHKTIAGHLVRSKSEVIISNALYLNKIPYRYEAALHYENLVLYPDFTIFHPKTNQIFYWEHFGMMDQPTYCENAYNKLKIYSNHGIIPSIHLITTYETQKVPIDSENIQHIIENYFLS